LRELVVVPHDLRTYDEIQSAHDDTEEVNHDEET
jgi:hypothetical protein